MPPRSAVILVIDRLGAGYLGPYGNTWIETPTLNRLASESTLWENAFSDCPTLASFYRALSWGTHAWRELPESPGPSLIEQITAAGVHSALVADEPLLETLPFSQAFRDRIVIPPASVKKAARTFEQTQIAHTLAAALDCLEQLPQPFLLWVHLRAMSGPWDAPREFREHFADEEDPTPPDFVNPPDRVLPRDVDPDEVLGVTQAYAGQVALLDLCLSTFLEGLAQKPGGADTLLVLTSPRGYALGEHGGIGPSSDSLHEEVIHVPLLLRVPEQQRATERLQSLVFPADLQATLRSWFEANQEGDGGDGADLLSDSNDSNMPQRQCVGSVFSDERCLRTPAWFIRQASDRSPELFAKPDDRWEINQVADRCPDIVELAMQALTTYEQVARSQRLKDLPPLADALIVPPE